MLKIDNRDIKSFNMKTVGQPGKKKEEKSSIKTASLDITKENRELLEEAFLYWSSLADFRDRRKRARMYYRGRQWEDKVYDPDNHEWITEEQLIINQGKVPLKQNQIRQLVKSLLGQFRLDTTKTTVIARAREKAQLGEMFTNTLEHALTANFAKEKDARGIEEFFVSGAVLQKTGYRFKNNLKRYEVTIDNVPITNSFFNTNVRDIALEDLRLIGQFYDLTLDELLIYFGDTEETEETLKTIYSGVAQNVVASFDGLSSDNVDGLDFYMPMDPTKCRVFEIWKKQTDRRLRCHDWMNGEVYILKLDQRKEIEQVNIERVSMGLANGLTMDEVPLIEIDEKREEFWKVKFLSPLGHLLFEAEEPYEHGEHPYTLMLYPLFDGEVWGFVEDIIDQQRYINRLVTLLDFIIGASAKGVLLVPDDFITPDMNIDDWASEWSKFNGVIKYKPKPGVDPPMQVTANSSNVGIHELLAMQQKYMQEIGGVSSAMQGQTPRQGTPAALYAQEAQNSTINSKDYFESFYFWKKRRDWKVLKTITQFYNEKRFLAIAGSNYADVANYYDPQYRDVDFELVLAQSPDSPVYRSLIDEWMKEFVLAGLIDVKMFLKNSSLPFAESLLSDIEKKEQMMAQANQAMPINDPNMMNQVGGYLQGQGANASQANPQAMNMLNKYMSQG